MNLSVKLSLLIYTVFIVRNIRGFMFLQEIIIGGLNIVFVGQQRKSLPSKWKQNIMLLLYPYARLDLCSVGCFCSSSLPFAALPIWIITFQKFRLEEKRMAYNNGRENRKWLIWKEAEEKILREHGVDETTIEQIRTDDRGYLCKVRPSV